MAHGTVRTVDQNIEKVRKKAQTKKKSEEDEKMRKEMKMKETKTRI